MIKKTIEEDSSESEDWCNVDSDYEGAPIVRPITSGVVVLEPGFVVEADGNVSDMDMPKMRKEASEPDFPNFDKEDFLGCYDLFCIQWIPEEDINGYYDNPVIDCYYGTAGYGLFALALLGISCGYCAFHNNAE
ncbi:MAG: hypothetical protein KA998_01890 [Rickettsiaceae bacterium]|nr:hypothetical protein [Rickettsiaceae bacterium]